MVRIVIDLVIVARILADDRIAVGDGERTAGADLPKSVANHAVRPASALEQEAAVPFLWQPQMVSYRVARPVHASPAIQDATHLAMCRYGRRLVGSKHGRLDGGAFDSISLITNQARAGPRKVPHRD